MRIISGLIFIALIFTLGVLFIQPKMHPQFIVYNYEFSVEPQTVKEEKKIVTPQKQKVQKPKTTTIVTKNKEQTKTTVQIKKETQKVTTEKKVTQKKKQEVQTISKPIAQTKTSEQKEQEEIIAWNIWHSNIQNTIMRETKMPHVPDGTYFRFSFLVDKYGKISNIRTWSDNPYYTSYALQYIAPVIRNLQGKSVLIFPQNSQRFETEFVGKFKITTRGQNVYSSASDFNDMEKIRK